MEITKKKPIWYTDLYAYRLWSSPSLETQKHIVIRHFQGMLVNPDLLYDARVFRGQKFSTCIFVFISSINFDAAYE